MDEDKKLNKGRLLELFERLSEHIPETTSEVKILLVGGALMMLNGDRESTYDVDAFSLEGRDLLRIIGPGVVKVAKECNLPPDWLNFDVENLGFNIKGMEYSLLWEFGKLKVFGVSDNTLLTMKVFAACERYGGDEEDIHMILKRTGRVSIKSIAKQASRIRPGRYFDSELAESILSEDSPHFRAAS